MTRIILSNDEQMQKKKKVSNFHEISVTHIRNLMDNVETGEFYFPFRLC